MSWHQFKYPEDFEEEGVDERALEHEDEEDLFEKIEDAESAGEFGEIIKGGEGIHTQDWIQVKYYSDEDKAELLSNRPWVVILGGAGEFIYVTLEKWSPDPFDSEDSDYFWARVSILPRSKYHLHDLRNLEIRCDIQNVCQHLDPIPAQHSLPEKVHEALRARQKKNR